MAAGVGAAGNDRSARAPSPPTEPAGATAPAAPRPGAPVGRVHLPAEGGLWAGPARHGTSTSPAAHPPTGQVPATASGLRKALRADPALTQVLTQGTGITGKELQAFKSGAGTLSEPQLRRAAAAANRAPRPAGRSGRRGTGRPGPPGSEYAGSGQPGGAQPGGDGALAPGSPGRPTCRVCGAAAEGKLDACRRCLLEGGVYRACPACTRLFAPDPDSRRPRLCPKCQASNRQGKPRSKSVHTVSGGLPSLGKRR